MVVKLFPVFDDEYNYPDNFIKISGKFLFIMRCHLPDARECADPVLKSSKFNLDGFVKSRLLLII